jgi:hypothetical protein
MSLMRVAHAAGAMPGSKTVERPEPRDEGQQKRWKFGQLRASTSRYELMRVENEATTNGAGRTEAGCEAWTAWTGKGLTKTNGLRLGLQLRLRMHGKVRVNPSKSEFKNEMRHELHECTRIENGPLSGWMVERNGYGPRQKYREKSEEEDENGPRAGDI